MSATKIIDVTSKLFALLEPLESGDRSRAIQAAFVLLNEALPIDAGPDGALAGRAGGPKQRTHSGDVTEKDYFALKAPESKIEELAVAAGFREEYMGASESTREDLAGVFRAARRNFDAKNYGRDLSNAKVKGLFSKGNGRNVVLSHHGQTYVDTLPDREALKQLRVPRKAAAKRTAAKKRTSKK